MKEEGKKMLFDEVLNLGLCSFISTEGMTEDQWLKLRTSGIGGSDSGAILGLSKYSTPLSIYLAKKEYAAFSGNNATRRGHLLEDPVRKVCREELGIEVETVPGMFRNKTYEFMNANFDGLCYIENELKIGNTALMGLGGHEIKTSKYGEDFSVDEVPDHYYSQCQHYMAVTGINWFILSVYILGSDELKHYAIPRNEEFISKLIEKETDFWENYVLKNEIPAPTGNEYESDLVDKLFDKTTENVELPDDFLPTVEEERSINAQIKELEKQDNALKEAIKLELFKRSNADETNSNGVICELGPYKITWKASERNSVDSAALKKDGIYENYTKKTVTHTLRISGGAK